MLVPIVEGMRAQQRWAEINGTNRSWFCGAYWRNGFHEDGVHSALQVVQGISEQPVPRLLGSAA